MEPCYAFDPATYSLGKLCRNGHAFPGTTQSLRKAVVVPKNAQGYGPYPGTLCVGCSAGPFRGAAWYWRFLDCDASGLPEGSKLGKLCPSSHEYCCTGLTLRDKHGKCNECEKIRKQSEAYKTTRLKWLEREDVAQALQAKRKIRDKIRFANMTPEARSARIKYKRQVRERRRQQGLTSRGTAPVTSLGCVPRAEAVRIAQERSARKLVAWAQRQAEWDRRRAERETPEWKEQERAKRLIQYALDEDLRIYNREKSKRRKALIKERHAVLVRARDIRTRFTQFDGCAYCGTHGDMHMDHFIPLAQGGVHALGNLVPACPSCNYSKTDHAPETWYRAQPFFTEKRWRKILRALGISKGSPHQLALL